jgi:hypothetical protein
MIQHFLQSKHKKRFGILILFFLLSLGLIYAVVGLNIISLVLAFFAVWIILFILDLTK